MTPPPVFVETDNGRRRRLVVCIYRANRPASVVRFFSDFTHHFPVDHRIQVLAQHVQYPPIADRQLVRHRTGHVIGYQSVVSVPQCVLPRLFVVHDQKSGKIQNAL